MESYLLRFKYLSMKWRGIAELMRRFRWLFLVLAILLVVQTPFALEEIVHEARADHRLTVVLVLAVLFRLGWIGILLFVWRLLHPNPVLPKMDAMGEEASDSFFTLERALYLAKENSWWRFKLFAYDDLGRLKVTDQKIVFQSLRHTIVIVQIRRVSFGKQGRDFINDWVKVDYIDGSTQRTAFFADGGSLG